ncbi:unnamed protein product [Bursaphelenchus xylophilus]|uniref:(pine wood nematode) hypothetical protein n=1 Tax=Bursaphelenchus xylophilus TaxID=6326 RepID=A0A1I7RKE8_BURXY|nr:unnamed protein product [Bursaphelenchus xylophilus]CAG9131360.1 unnamed protein product [Bursaphelenchus xylophilus]
MKSSVLYFILFATTLAFEIPVKRLVGEPEPFASGVPIDRDVGSTVYIGTVSIGNPGQDFNVAFDVNSAALWVPDSACSCGIQCESKQLCPQLCAAHCCTTITNLIGTKAKGTCTKKNIFDASKSRSYVKTSGKIEVSFLNETVDATLAYDTFRIGSHYRPGPTSDNVQFALVKDFPESYQKVNYDGVFGIGLAVGNALSSPIKQMAEHGVIPKPLLTVYLLPLDADNVVDGVLTLGQVDLQRCDRVENFIQVEKREGWVFSSPVFNASSSASVSDPGWKGTFDFSTDYIHIPPKAFTAVISSLSAKIDEEGRVVFACNRATTFVFNIGGQPILVPSTELTVPWGGGNCLLKLKQISPHDNYAFRFGAIALAKHCVVFDFNGRLALPKKKAKTSS